MKVDRDGNDWTVVDDKGVVQGRFATSSAAWRYADRLAGDPISPAEKRSAYGFEQSAMRSNPSSTSAAAVRRAPRDNEAWQWPEGLHPLRDWLAARHVDVGSIKGPRQALHFTSQLGAVKERYPKKGKEISALVALQRRLTGQGRGRPAPSSAVRRERGFGTFGAASEVRPIDPVGNKIGGTP